MSTDVVKPERTTQIAQPESQGLDLFIQRALGDPNFDTNKIDILERLMKVKRGMDGDRKRELFFEALARVQAAAPRIKKNGLMDRGEGKGKIAYAKREDIDAMMRPIYQAEGFSVTWNYPMNDNRIQVVGSFTAFGHTEKREWSCLPDSSGGKPNPQASGSTTAYGQRYVSIAFWDIITEGADVNGIDEEKAKPITEKQAKDLTDRINAMDPASLSKFCKVFGVKSVDRLTVGAYPSAVAAVEKKERSAK